MKGILTGSQEWLGENPRFPSPHLRCQEHMLRPCIKNEPSHRASIVAEPFQLPSLWSLWSVCQVSQAPQLHHPSGFSEQVISFFNTFSFFHPLKKIDFSANLKSYRKKKRYQEGSRLQSVFIDLFAYQASIYLAPTVCQTPGFAAKTDIVSLSG